jgi:hypothetical protein
MVAEAGPSIVVVPSVVKWFTASVVVLWQAVHEIPVVTTWKMCSPELYPLN